MIKINFNKNSFITLISVSLILLITYITNRKNTKKIKINKNLDENKCLQTFEILENKCSKNKKDICQEKIDHEFLMKNGTNLKEMLDLIYFDFNNKLDEAFFNYDYGPKLFKKIKKIIKYHLKLVNVLPEGEKYLYNMNFIFNSIVKNKKFYYNI